MVFIVLEGINGCGKSVQALALAGFLYRRSKSDLVFMTREPNELDENGMLARKMLASEGSPYDSGLKAADFFAKNRVAHNALINFLIGRGVHVVSDRYWHSNFAFQHAQGVPYEVIAGKNSGCRAPDLTVVLDVPVDVAFSRLSKRDGDKRRLFDSEKDFMEKVRANYLELPSVLPSLAGDKNIVVIDGAGSIEEVGARIRREYESLAEKLYNSDISSRFCRI